MRFLRPLLLALLALALAVAVAVTASAGAQGQAPTVKLPGGGEVKVKLPPVKGKKPKKPARTKAYKVKVGIADEKADMFRDPRFKALGIKTARRSVAWDVFDHDFAIREMDDWLLTARAAGVSPLITFARSRINSRLHTIPTRTQMRTAFKKFRKRWPWVREFVATNESNFSDPGFKRPELAAQYYLDMRKACRTCKVAGATLLEVPGREKYMKTWVRRFVKKAKHWPKYWAVHNYVSANAFSVKGTKTIAKIAKKGELWVTETGGLVDRRSSFGGKVKMKEGLAHAARVTRFIFDKMLAISPRIKRVYLYHWNASTPTDTWDSGLIASDGRARGSFTIVKAKLKKR